MTLARRPKRSPDDVKLRDEPVPWEPGQHVAVIGHTGTGKTTLMSSLIDMREYVIFFRTKSDDVRFKSLTKVRDTKRMDDLFSHRLMFEPMYERQGSMGGGMIEKAWRQGGWTVFLDELFYLHKIGLQRHVDMLLTQGRSKRISVVAGMQRPVHVTRFALSEVTHIFSFALEPRDAKVIAEITNDDYAEVVSRLPRYRFAHWHVPTRTIAVGEAHGLGRVLATMRGKPRGSEAFGAKG